MVKARKKAAPASSDGGWSGLWRLVRQWRWRVAAIAVISFGGAMLEAGMLVLLTNTVMAIAEGRDSLDLLGRTVGVSWTLAAVAIILVLRLVAALAGVRVAAGLSIRLLTALQQRVTQAYLRASWAIQQAQPSGRLQEILSGFVGQAVAAVSSAAGFVTAALSLTAFLTAAVVVDPVATGLVVVALVVLGGLLAPVRRRIRRQGAITARTGLEFAKAVAELGTLGLEMQVFGVQDRFTDRIRALTRDNARTRYRADRLMGSLAPTYMSLAYGAVVAGIAVLSVQQGTSDLASVGAVLLLMLRSLSYGQNLQSASGQIQSKLPYIARLEETIAEFHGAAASGGTARPASVTPVELEDVSFAYTADRDALTDVSLRIEPHEIIGVVGPSGAGKSTLVQLLLGLREPTSGVVRVGGANLPEVDRSVWTSRVALVAQDALLFTGTVAENIRFFRDGIDDASVRRAAVQANLLADIEGLPDGFDTHLGERGSQLSGGQRQRLSIARALAGQPELLILDEPTSALDVRSEGLIRDTLTALRGRTTVIIIAHRMSTLDICDRILVIEEGRATAFGSPQELNRTNEFYRNALAMSGMTARPSPESDPTSWSDADDTT